MLIRVYAQIRQAQAQLRQVAGSINAVNAAQDRGAASARRSEAAMVSALRTGTKFGNQLQWTGRQLEYNWTLPIAVAGVSATKWALDSEKAMTRVRKVYGDLDMATNVFKNETKALEGAFTALSNFYGQSREAVIGIAADWAAAGVSGVALARSTENTLKAMVLGEMDATKATEALISIQSQYHLSSKGLTDTLAQLNIVENQTGISMQGLIEGFTRTAGVARSAGIDTQHLAAMLAALTPAAGSAAQAGNALKTIISRLLVPTNEAREVLGMMGINVADAGWQSMNAAQRLEFLSKSYSKLTGQQRAVVNATVASRWQLNKFDVLMAAMVKTNSFYYKALDATADRSKYLAQAQKELNIVLDSSPQKMKQIWTILQNAAQDTIVPLIPTIVMLGQKLAKLAQDFANLPPEVQKLIGIGLLLLALVGPVTRYLGSLSTLVFTLGRAFHIAAVPLFAFVGGFARIVAMPFGAISGGLRGISASLALFLSKIRIAPFVTAFQNALKGLPLVFHGINQIILSILIGDLGRGRIMSALKGMRIGFAMTFAQLITAGKGWMAALAVSLLSGLKALPMMLLKFLVGPWGIALAAVGTILYAFRNQIGTVFNNVRDMLLGPWTQALEGLNASAGFFDKFIAFIKQAFWSLPVEVQNAMIAVVTVVQKTALAVYEWFSYINPFARHSPSLVENVKNGVAQIVSDFKGLGAIQGTIDSAYKNIKKLKDLTAGFQASERSAERKGQLKNLGKVAPGAVGVFRALTGELDRLQAKLDSMEPSIRRQEGVVKQWQTRLDAANKALQKQNDILDALRSKAQGYEDAINAAEEAASQFANAPLVGMGAMEEQIFSNEIAQKKLRLEMLKMEQAGQTFDDIKGKIDSLNGDIEMLRSTQSDLRAGGAGSDILSFYDDELKKIDQQKSALEKQAEPYEKLASALDELQRKAEIMDLEKALKFDPLTHQIDNLMNAQKELSFDEIVAGIKKAKAEAAKYQPQLNAVNKEIAIQEAYIKKLELAQKAVQARYDSENEKLSKMKDAYEEVSRAMQDVSAALDDINSKIDSHLNKIKKATEGGAKKKGKKLKAHELTPAGKAFQDAQGVPGFKIPGGTGAPGREGGPGDQSKLIDEYTKGLTTRLGQILGGADIFGPLKKKWTEVTAWFNKNIAPAWGPIKEGISRIFAGVDWGAPFRPDGAIGKFVTWLTTVAWPGIKNFFTQLWWWVKNVFGDDFKVLFTETWKALKDAFADVAPELGKFFAGMKDVLPILKVIGIIILGTLIVALKGLVKFLSRVLPPVIRMVGGIFKGLIMIFRGVRDFVVGVLTMDFKKAFGGLATIVKGAFTAAWAVLRGVVEIGIGIIRSTVGTFLDLFGTVFKKLLGEKFAAAWDGAIKKLRDFGDSAVKFVGDTFKKIGSWCSWAYDKVIGWFAKIYDELVGHSIVPDTVNAILKCFKDLWAWLTKPLQDIYNRITGKFNDLKTWIKGAWSKAWSAVKTIITNPIDSAKKALDTLLGKTGIRSAFTSVKSWMSDTWSKSWSVAKKVIQDPIGLAKTGIDVILGKTGLRDVFGKLYSWFKDTWISKSWNSVKDKLTKPIKDSLTAIKDVLTGKKSIKTAFSDAVTAIGDAWDNLKGKVKSPIRWVVDTALDNGLLRAFRSISSFVGYKSGSGFHVSLPKGFAGGGSTGPGSKFQPAGIVHADEHVFTKEEVHKYPGGHAGLAAMRRALRSGKYNHDMPGYAQGGKVDAIGSITRTVISAAGKKAQQAIKNVSSKLHNSFFTLDDPQFSKMISKLPGKLVGAMADRLKERAAAFIKKETKKVTSIIGDPGGPAGTGSAKVSSWHGGRFTERFINTLKRAQGYAGRYMSVTQGGFRPTTSYSGSTHNKDAIDVPWIPALLRGLRKARVAAWHRSPSQGPWPHHIHGVPLPGAGFPSGSAAAQARSYLRGGNGLGGYAAGTFGSRAGMAMVGERGPELMRLTGGTKIVNNRLLRMEMTEAFKRGLTDSTATLEQTVVDTVSAAMRRADRRIAASDRGVNSAGATQGGTTIIQVDHLELPNIKNGDDAQAFIDNLKKLTSR